MVRVTRRVVRVTMMVVNIYCESDEDAGQSDEEDAKWTSYFRRPS